MRTKEAWLSSWAVRPRYNVGKPGMVLKDEQLMAIHHVYNGKDAFVWLPTDMASPLLWCFRKDRNGYRYHSPGSHSSVWVATCTRCSGIFYRTFRMRKQCTKSSGIPTTRQQNLIAVRTAADRNSNRLTSWRIPRNLHIKSAQSIGIWDIRTYLN